MIKILHIARPVGGVGTYIELLDEYLDRKDFKNIMLCNEEDDLSSFKKNTSKNLELFHINLKREVLPLNDITCLFKIISKIKEVKPNIIHCHSAKAGILGRLAGAYLGITTFYTPHAYSYLSSASTFKRMFFKNLERLFRKFPAKTLCCSESEYNRTINDLDFNKSKVLLWKNSIKDPLFFLEERTRPISLPENYICSIGRPSFQKNTQLLVDVMYEIKKQGKELTLVVLGVGFYSPAALEVKKMIKEKGLTKEVLMIEWTTRRKTLEILKNSLLYVSTSKYEGLPYSMIEALSLSKACVVTNVDGNRDLVKNKFNGYKLNEDAKEISESILKLMESDDEREKMGENSRELFETSFNIERNILLLQEIYKKAILK